MSISCKLPSFHLKITPSTKLSDIFTIPDWLICFFLILLAVVSFTLISGHGGWFIAGYNTASKKEQEKCDRKKLCRTVGGGMLVITVLALLMMIFEHVLPAGFAYIAVAIVLADVVVIGILSATICRK